MWSISDRSFNAIAHASWHHTVVHCACKANKPKWWYTFRREDGETRGYRLPLMFPHLFFCSLMTQGGSSIAKMVNDKNSNFNPNVPTLKQVRERLGMTQEEFAQAVGLSRNTIGRYERGEHQRLTLSVAQIKRLVELVEQAGLSIKDLPDDIDWLTMWGMKCRQISTPMCQFWNN